MTDKKNDPLLGVPLKSLYVIKLDFKDLYELSSDLTIQCVIALGWIFPPFSLPLTILFYYAIQMISRILVHPILVYVV